MLHSARNSWQRLGRWAVMLIACVGLAAASPAIAQEQQAQQQEEQFFGWAGEQAAAEALRGFGDRIQTYQATDDDYDNVVERKICLWDQMKASQDGRHLPTRKQQIGDCVSWGFGHAVEYSLAVHLAVTGEGGRFVEVYKPYLYGAGRVFCGGGRLGGDGSTGAWQSRALEEFGVLAVDADGVPPYSGGVARQWGAPPGPPEKFVRIAKKYRAECKLITSWKDAAVSIGKGAPVAVCSGYGFAIRTNDKLNRIEGYRSGSWPHCMCFIAVDARKGCEALYCLNSWGENAHAPAARYAQLDNAPPGGFWVLRADVEGMLRSRDSYSVRFSGFVDRTEKSERLFGQLDSEQGDNDARSDWLGVAVGGGDHGDLGDHGLRPVGLPADAVGLGDRSDWTRRFLVPERRRELRRLVADGAALAG